MLPAPLDPGLDYVITAVYGSEESESFTGSLDWDTLVLSTLSGAITGLSSGQNAMVHIISATALLEKTVNLTGTGSPVPYQFDNLLPADDYIVSIVGDGIPVTYYDGVTDITLAAPQDGCRWITCYRR